LACLGRDAYGVLRQVFPLPIQVVSEKPEIASVCLEEDVEHGPKDRNTAYHGVERDVAGHLPNEELWRANLRYAIYQVGGHDPRRCISQPGNETYDGVNAEPYVGAGNAPTRIQKERQVVEGFNFASMIVR
jgi:hypothetical protein